MRIPVLAILALATAAMSAPAQAQTYDPNYPICLQVYQGGMTDYYFDCSYTTMGQCQASASGRSAQCVVNPYPAKAIAPKGKARQRRSQQYQ